MSRATRWQTLMRLRIPSALPYFFGGLRIASGLALIGAVVAEFVAGTGGQGAGLAYQILLAGIQLNIPRLFAALVLITLAGRRAVRATVLAVARSRSRAGTRARRRRGDAGRGQPAILSPTMPARISAMQASRAALAGSPNSTMPSATVPTAPMPVHTA